jgi:hypothetical protein
LRVPGPAFLRIIYGLRLGKAGKDHKQCVLLILSRCAQVVVISLKYSTCFSFFVIGLTLSVIPAQGYHLPKPFGSGPPPFIVVKNNTLLFH